MKKVAIILAIVLAVIVGTYFADKATRLSGKTHTSVATPDSGALNKPEPELTLKDLDGQDISLAQYKGKVVLVNFWATWCDPCRVEIPWMIEFQQKYASQGFTMLGVAMDDEGAEVVKPFVQRTQFDVDGHQATMNYPIVTG